jgi:hypothetical protein
VNGTFILGDIPGQAVIVTDAVGNIGVVSGLAINDISDLRSLLFTDLVTDSDSFPVPAVSATASLLPALVTDADAIYAAIVGAAAIPLAAPFYTDSDTIFVPTVVPGAVSVIAAFVDDQDIIEQPILVDLTRFVLPNQRHFDDEPIFAPTVTAFGATQHLLPPFWTDVTFIHLPSVATVGAPRTLLPSKVNDTETVYPAYSIDAAKPPKEQRLRAPRTNDLDTIYSARFPLTPTLPFVDADIIYAVILDIYYPLTAAFVTSNDVIYSPFIAMQALPALVANDDVIYGAEISLFLVPELLADEEDIPFADVGWQVIAEFTDDADEIFPINVLAYNDLLPETWLDEEHIDTYPFFVQSIEGGIQVPKPPGILTGSVIPIRRTLTGSVTPTRRTLTGSFANKTRRVLTGSMRRK